VGVQTTKAEPVPDSAPWIEVRKDEWSPDLMKR